MERIKPLRSMVVFLLLVWLSACNGDDDMPSDLQKSSGQKKPFHEQLDLSKDKARYDPGQTVRFSVSELPTQTMVRYKKLGRTIMEEPLKTLSWEWQPPALDFQGYMVELVQTENTNETILGTTAVDVSSDWTQFPRYGFLSHFGKMEVSKRDAILDNLKDFHINGIQFYDWHAKHHIPLPLDVEGTPADQWKDLFNRDVELATVKGYVESAHQRNMASMFYNLVYGAWHPEEGDGFSEQWLLYNDRFHGTVNHHDLGDFGKLLVTDPGNREWQDYILERTAEVFEHLDFDGWHIDQLGNRGAVYDYGGYKVDLPKGFQDFMGRLNGTFTGKKYVFNAVDQFGQEEILSSPVHFAYSEVWDRNQYADLAQVVQENHDISDGRLNTVLAAYMNYGSNHGNFNTPAVLLTDAVIFAFGGAHLELGEHMLSSEYFPNSTLDMDDELTNALKEYYDFMVAYQNVLRDGGTPMMPSLTPKNLDVGYWPPVLGRVAVIGKQLPGRSVLHMLNFDGVATLDWRDVDRNQNAPNVFESVELTLSVGKPVEKVWFASPDFNGGASEMLDFVQSNGKITFTVPYLYYWSMIVIEN